MTKKQAANGSRNFEYNGAVIVVRDPRNRLREQVRQVAERIKDAGLSFMGAHEFATAVVYTQSGDEAIWKRPDAGASKSVLMEALDVWLDEVSPNYTDALMSAIYGEVDPVTTTADLGDVDDPNS